MGATVSVHRLEVFVRNRSLFAVSAVAVAAILLAGCGTSDPEPDASADALCAAAAPSGSASEAVTVEGETGEESTATFEFPLEVGELQSSVVTEGEGDPVESGDLVSYALTAYSAETGEELWKFQTGSGVVGQPITWEMDGDQYVSVTSGWGGAVPLWGGEVAKRVKFLNQGGSVWVFKIPDGLKQ